MRLGRFFKGAELSVGAQSGIFCRCVGLTQYRFVLHSQRLRYDSIQSHHS